MKIARLADLCDIGSGGTPRRGRSEYYGGVIPWAKIGDLNTSDGIVTSTEETLTEVGLSAIRKRLFPPGTILLAMYGSVGKTAVAGVPLSANQAILGIQVKDAALLRSDYLKRWLDHLRPRLASQARGVTQQNISAAIVRNLRVPLPAPADQERIAAVLDKADGIRRKRQESLRLLDELLRSAFLEMFGNPVKNEMGWRTEKLRHIASVHGGLQVTSRRIVNNREVPYLRVANVQRGWIDLGEVKGLRVTDDEAKRARLEPGDVLVVEGHGNREEIGRSAVWEGTIVECVHQNHLIRVRPNTASVDPHFLSAFVNSASGRRQMLALGKTTSGLNTISTENVRQLVVAVPPLQLQQKYARLRALVEVAKSRFTTAGDVSSKLVASLQQTLLAESRGG